MESPTQGLKFSTEELKLTYERMKINLITYI